MSKRFSVSWLTPSEYDFFAIMVRAEFVPSVNGCKGWYSLTLALLGFGVYLTMWRDPDVYGDGGVA